MPAEAVDRKIEQLLPGLGRTHAMQKTDAKHVHVLYVMDGSSAKAQDDVREKQEHFVELWTL